MLRFISECSNYAVKCSLEFPLLVAPLTVLDPPFPPSLPLSVSDAEAVALPPVWPVLAADEPGRALAWMMVSVVLWNSND